MLISLAASEGYNARTKTMKSIAMMTTREQLLQELKNSSDNVLLPVLNFLQILKTHPQEGEILGQMITDRFQVLEQAPDYEEWLAETYHKVEVALEQIDRGEVLDSEIVIDRLQAKVNQASK